jgi:isopropylmalate/homocitrate/citramalate synthase
MATAQDTPGRRIAIREITLRQLGHMDAELSFAEKRLWLQALDDAGVDATIVWGVDADAAALVEATHAAGLKLQIGFYGKVFFPEETRRILDKARDCDADFVCFNGRGGAFALAESGWTAQQMLDACVATVRDAKDRGLTISLGLYAATQAEPGYVAEVARAVEEAGADMLYLPDSLGVASPEAIRAMISEVRAAVSIPLEAHCHNDYGLATANAIAAVQAGADSVEVAVNGQDPERSGITALDEIVVALEYLYGFRTGVKLDRLTALSRRHEAMTRMRIAENKPVVGRTAFNYRVASGPAPNHPKRDVFYGSPRVVPFDPTTVGNERAFLIGKFSGANEIAKKLGELGLDVAPERLDTVVRLVNDRGRSEKRVVRDDELRYFAQIA